MGNLILELLAAKRVGAGVDSAAATLHRATIGLSVLVMLIALATVAQSQSASEPHFEVASIKLNKTANANSATGFLPGGVFSATNATLTNIIGEAYRMRDDQIQGGPKWIDSDRFDVTAKPANGTKSEEALLMLQTLLEDRFQLKVHQEARDINGYVLVLSKDGPKIKLNSDAICAPPCGGTSVSASGKLTSRKVPLSRFANRLTEIVGRPVVDATGLAGEFDIDLDWAPVTGEFGGRGREIPNDPRPSFFTALQEQLGLKLEPHKTPINILMVDRAEIPREN
jgi:uncharacterized protein (TIGR03435 family)